MPKQASADAGEDNITGFIFGWVIYFHYINPLFICEPGTIFYQGKELALYRDNDKARLMLLFMKVIIMLVISCCMNAFVNNYAIRYPW